MALGYNHPQVNEVIIKQLQTKAITHMGYRYENDDMEEAAEVLLNSLSFSDGQSIFLSSGCKTILLLFTLL